MEAKLVYEYCGIVIGKLAFEEKAAGKKAAGKERQRQGKSKGVKMAK